jgi:hypothetical protein
VEHAGKYLLHGIVRSVAITAQIGATNAVAVVVQPAFLASS